MDVPVPPAEVLEQLGITGGAFIGGGHNHHWLAIRNGERVVLRRYAERDFGDRGYELNVLARLDSLGWPVPYALEPTVEIEGRAWCLFKWLRGEPRPNSDSPAEERVRGRLLANLHTVLAQLTDLGQRSGWSESHELLADPALASALRAYERWYPDDARILQWHRDRALQLFDCLGLGAAARVVLHSDFTSWNLHYEGNTLTGVLDFDATHLNYLVADFALSWRGSHDNIIAGYEEVRPLTDLDWALLTPVYWSWLYIGLAKAIGRMTDGAEEPSRFAWSVTHLLRRSTLMGTESTPYQFR